MVMSHGTYTFLACFAGFWLVWALIVMLCCFCSFLQRRLKRRREERLREQCLRTVEVEPLSCHPAGYPPAAPPPPPPPPPPTQLPREPPQFCPPHTLSSPPVPLPVPHPMPQATWVCMPDTDIFGKPPCYEEAVLMEDPPPPYSEVLADPRGGHLSEARPAPSSAATASAAASQGTPGSRSSVHIRDQQAPRGNGVPRSGLLLPDPPAFVPALGLPGSPPVQYGPEPQQPRPVGRSLTAGGRRDGDHAPPRAQDST
ncbi:proline-rich protein 7 [Lates japonicus]